MKEEDADLDEIQPSETKNSEEYDLSFKFMMIIEPPLPPIDDKHENDKDANFSQAVEALTRLFPDVHGRMTELCRPTQKKYTLAVTVAMGRFMDDVVLEKNKLEFWNCFQPPNLNEIALKFSCQENDSTDVTSMMDGFGRSCPKLQIASLQLSRSVVLSLTAANLRGLHILSLAFGPEVTDASVIMDCLGSVTVPNLSELNSNSCKALLPEKLVLQCSKLESVHVVGCPDVVVQADSATCFLNSDVLMDTERRSTIEAYFDVSLGAMTMFDSKIDKLDQKAKLLNLIVEDLEFQFSKTLVDHPNNSRLKDIKAKYNGIIQNTDLSVYTYAIEDDRIHHESRYGNDFRETDYSLNFNDTSGTYHVRECSHGVEELDKDFINETDEENGEESSEEEMIEVVNQKVIKADIVLKKSINDYIQNKEQNSIDEDFLKVRMDEEKDEEILNQDVSEVNVLKVIEAEPDSISEKSREDHMVIINKDEDEFNEFKVKKDTSFDFKTFDIPKIDDKEKSTVSVFEDCLTKGLFRQVAEPDNSIISFGNPFRDSRNDMPNHRLDEAPSFSLGPEFDDFSIEEINQTNVNDANITINPNIESGVGFSETEADCSQKEKQSLDRILKVSFRPESEVDVLKEDIKPEIKDASIRMQPKREASVACLSQAEVLTADTLFIMDEESDPINFKITRISLESLAPELKIDQSVIDAWVDLLNFDERNKSSGSSSRYFFKPILVNGSLKFKNYITTEYRLYKFEECINLCDYETKRMLNSDKMFHLIIVLDWFHMKTGKVVIIDNSSVDDDLTTRQRYFKLPQALISVFDKYISKSKFAARILLSENNSFKDEFQKEVEKVRSIDKKTRRELIEKAVLRRPAKVDEYFGKMKP
ncbi:RNA-directed DNA polymerase, eukaryota [Tanacetum coccineum]